MEPNPFESPQANVDFRSRRGTISYVALGFIVAGIATFFLTSLQPSIEHKQIISGCSLTVIAILAPVTFLESYAFLFPPIILFGLGILYLYAAMIATPIICLGDSVGAVPNWILIAAALSFFVPLLPLLAATTIFVNHWWWSAGLISWSAGVMLQKAHINRVLSKA